MVRDASPTVGGDGMTSGRHEIFTVTATDELSALATADLLAAYSVVVFVNNCGPDVLGTKEVDVMRAWFEGSGGGGDADSRPRRGFVGIHAASAANGDDPWYGPILVGGVFKEHPAPAWGVVRIAADADGDVASEGEGYRNTRERLTRMWRHPRPQQKLEAGSESGLGAHRWFDEWYRYRHPLHINPESEAGESGLNILLVADEEGESSDKVRNHPVAWCREFGGGASRSVYIQLGHFEEAWHDQRLLDMVRESIVWAAGEDEAVLGS